MECPICSFVVADARGLASHFRHQAETHPKYALWKEGQRWEGKVEDEDFVRCRKCGHRAATLAGHLRSHGFTAATYREQYDGALIRARRLTEKRQEAFKVARASEAYQGQKTVLCPSCGQEHVVHKLSGVVPCPACRSAELEAEKAAWFEGKTEPEDYVTCLDCGYRSESLVSHTQSAHPDYRQRRPDALMVALGSAIRDKTALRGRTVSEETRQKMSENAGRWSKGLTKETHPSLASQSQKMLGKPCWSKGLTAKEDPRLAETARKLRMYVGDLRTWDNGLAANLTLEDFKPFMDSEGRVDHHKVVEATGISWPTVVKYIVDLGLEQTNRYIKEAGEDRVIRLDKALLETFKLDNGKVSIGKAMSVTGHTFGVIKRECERHDLPTFHRRIRQTICMDVLAAALGGMPYQMEWESVRFTNPPTGRRFRFDALFPDIGLVVEFQGHQHYTFPNAYMPDESYLPVYESQRERDRIKRELIEAAPDLTYFEVTEEEPYADLMYLKGRVFQAGLIR